MIRSGLFKSLIYFLSVLASFTMLCASMENVLPICEQNNSDLFKIGNDLLNHGRINDTTRFYEGILEMNISQEETCYHKGRELRFLEEYNHGFYEECSKLFDKAIEQGRRSEDAWIHEGFAIAGMKWTMGYSNKTGIINFNLSSVWINNGIVLDKLGLAENALVFFDKAIELDTNSSLAWNLKGLSFMHICKYKNAVECYDRAIDINPKLTEARINKCNALAAQGKFDEATESINQAIESDLKLREAWTGKDFDLANPVKISQIRGHLSKGEGIWTACNFSWFNYDPDSGSSGERLEIMPQGRQLDKDHLLYTSRPWSCQFEYKNWGYFYKLSFLGKDYLAGYPENSFTENISVLERGELREILLNSGESATLAKNKPLLLEDGYSLHVADFSVEGNRVQVVLMKNGKAIYSAVVGKEKPFVYRAGAYELPVIIAECPIAMKNENGEIIVQVDGIFQVDDAPSLIISPGDKLDNLEVTKLTRDQLVMSNFKDFYFFPNRLICICENLFLKIAGTSTLLYYPIAYHNENGIYMQRGGATEGMDTTDYKIFDLIPIRVNAAWDYSDFSAFYFDAEDDIGREALIINGTEDGSIPFSDYYPNDPESEFTGIIYYSLVQSKEFEFRNWGHYYVISLFGNLWCASFDSKIGSSIGNSNLIEKKILGRLLVDSDEKDFALAGKNYSLRECYALEFLDAVNDRIFLRLSKNGKLVDNSTLNSNTTYVYKMDLKNRFDLGDVKDVPIIILQIGQIFRDNNQTEVEIDGKFQMSDKFFIPVNIGREYGELEVAECSPERIVIVSTDWIDLNRDSSINLWPNYPNFIRGLDLWVANNDTVRYFPYTLDFVNKESNLSQDSFDMH